ncbi:MAG: 2-oxoacid:acceptor oxidoreductase subunit alpha [Coriobacteriia bacterium]|nr:2-oxoacid:acceptor oxidoreductase subunit alpha [Coriobacteriia bacterium]
MPQPAPYGREVRIRIGGPAGFGIKAAGQTLARVFARAGYHTFDLTEYPSLIKGGHNTYHLRVSEDEIFSHVMPTDILVALDAPTIALHLGELTSGGAIVFDPHDVAADAIELAGRDDICLVPVPLTDIVYEVGGIKIMRNVVALGAVLGHLEFPLDGLVDSLRHQFAHKAPEIAEQNVAAATRGHVEAANAHCDFPFRLAPRGSVEPFVLADGNEAVGVGALAAGLGFYAAYPMTPASSLLSFMAKHADASSVVVKHTEDEIAAMNMVVGAAFGGTRAMCATSGGGFSLMVEALGFAGVSESAVVVGLFTRPGPATGLPTWTEQSDLRFAIHAAQGEFPRVVLAPGDQTDAFELGWKAFNLADQLQTPVIVLGDTYLSDNRQTQPAFDTAAVTIDRGQLQTTGEVEEYARYRVTDSGVSPRVVPGVVGAQQIVNSYEHDEHGWGAPGEERANRIAQSEKRARKFELAKTLVPKPVEFGPHEAAVSVILFGTTKMPTLEAAKWLAAEGVTVNVLQLVTVWPFPADAVHEFLERSKRSIVIEQNATGQLEGLIREHTLREVGHRLNRTDGRPISPEQVYAFVHDILGRHVELTAAGAIATSEGGR